jgi:hypothetical protein
MKQFLLLFLPVVFFLTSCKDTGSPTAPKPPVDVTEPAALKLQATSIEQALAANDAQALKSLIAPKFASVYSSAIDGAGSKLAGFGELFKSRTLVLLDSTYAVYQISYNGSTYEVSFGLEVDGTWKLTNF